jgi:hypothetical protein
MFKTLKEKLEYYPPDLWPLCKIYGECLYAAKEKLKLPIEEIREQFGGYTSKEWLEFLYE